MRRQGADTDSESPGEWELGDDPADCNGRYRSPRASRKALKRKASLPSANAMERLRTWNRLIPCRQKANSANSDTAAAFVALSSAVCGVYAAKRTLVG